MRLQKIQWGSKLLKNPTLQALVNDVLLDDLTMGLDKCLGTSTDTTEGYHIYILDDGGIGAEHDHLLCHEKEFTVFIVLTLSGASLPFLKYADFVVFTSVQQARLYRDTYVETTDHTVYAPSPCIKLNDHVSQNELTIVIPYAYKRAEYLRDSILLMSKLDQYNRNSFSKVSLVLNNTTSANELILNDIETTLGISTDSIVIYDDTQTSQAIINPLYTVVFEPKSISPYDIDDYEKIIGSSQLRVTEFYLRTELFTNALSDNSRNFDTHIIHSDYESKTSTQLIDKICKTHKQFGIHKASTPLVCDDLDSLNIIFGKPLANRYIISILYRNAGNKLIRAIESTLHQAPCHDVGIVVIDDCSTDDSCSKAIEILKASAIDCVVVKNNERKYAARNYYNVIHHLCIDDESIIIDLDGDDYFNKNIETFRCLSNCYSNPKIFKSIGSYILYSDDAVDTLQSSDFFQAMSYFSLNNPIALDSPWNIASCPSWKHLRTTKRGLLKRVEIDYFMERSKLQWLRMEHDISVHSRAIELEPNAVAVLNDRLYVYDISGDNHDNIVQDKTKNSYIYKLFHAYTYELNDSKTQTQQVETERMTEQETEIDFI